MCVLGVEGDRLQREQRRPNARFIFVLCYHDDLNKYSHIRVHTFFRLGRGLKMLSESK